MDKELKKIKKLYGEAMMHFCRDNFALILETPDLLLNILTSNFHPTHELYKDLEENCLILQFKEFIFAKVGKKEEKEIKVTESPEELMAQVGYDLFECLSEDDIQKFRKYYAKGEELCTFWTNRLKNNRVFFAVKKNVDELKREDFKNPKRQDEYGTSVISIQFTKDGTNTLSIKNRYNHTVSNPDATFSNNLDNIIPGLTDSFEEYYGLKQLYKNESFEIRGYVLANDGKYYKYNYEIDNIYYCPDNIIIYNLDVIKYPKEKYLILDYFVIELVDKRIIQFNDYIKDSFLKSINDIQKIDILKQNEEKIILITTEKGPIEIKLDKLNRIIGYKNNNIIEIDNNFLYFNEVLNCMEINKVEKIGDSFLYKNEKLKRLVAPNLKEVDRWFLMYNRELLVLDLPNLKQVGISFLDCNKKLNELYLPKLETIDSNFLGSNQALKKINLPNLKEVGAYFLYYNKNLTILNLPKLKIIGNHFLTYNTKLETIYLPNLKTAGLDFLTIHEDCALKVFIAPKLTAVGNTDPLELGNIYSNLQTFVAGSKKPLSLKKNRNS